MACSRLLRRMAILNRRSSAATRQKVSRAFCSSNWNEKSQSEHRSPPHSHSSPPALAYWVYLGGKGSVRAAYPAGAGLDLDYRQGHASAVVTH